MEFDVEERKQQLAEFSVFISETYSHIDGILQSVGWTREHLCNEASDKVCCPLNAEHKVPKSSLNDHIQNCNWRQEGYHDMDDPLPENCNADPGSLNSSIVMDASLQLTVIKEAKGHDPSLQTGNLESDERLVPKTSNRLMAEFTPDERRVLYDYVISKTTPVDDVKVEELQMIGSMKSDEKPRPKSKLELLIEERDAKRRRISYKKKVHTNRKSHTEIIREVIENQTELLEQIIKEDHGQVKIEEGSLGDESNSLSSSRNICIDDEEVYKDSEREVKRLKVSHFDSSRSQSDGGRRKYSENDSQNNVWLERPKAYQRDQCNSNVRKERNEKREYKNSEMTSFSFKSETFRDKYSRHDLKGRENFEEYGSHDKIKNYYHHKSGRNAVESVRHCSRQSEDHYHFENTNNDQHRKDYSHHSYHKSLSRYENSRNGSESEIHHNSEYKQHRHLSNHGSSNYGAERGESYKANKLSNKFRGSLHHNDKKDFKSIENNNYSDEYSSGFGKKSLLQEEGKVKIEGLCLKELEFDSRKHSDDLKILKRKKKKKKKHHKHKSKKKSKKKKYYSSSSSQSSKSASDGSDSS